MKNIGIIIVGCVWCVVFSHALGAQPEPKTGGTLIWGRGADSISLDPARIADTESAKVIENIFDGLVRYNDESTDVEPSLAVSWETSEDGKEWVFHLREDVFFHDGTPFNAEAVEFSFLRQFDPQHPFYHDDFTYANFMFQYIKNVEALDPQTVKISLERPYAPFLSNLGMFAAKIVSPTAMRQRGDAFGKHPVGTGAFTFVEWIPNDLIVLAKNERYWGPPPYVDKVVFKTIPDNKSRLLALKTSAIHGMDGIDPDGIEEIEMKPELHLLTRPGINVGFIAMNTEKSPFDQLKVRQAINHAINKQNLVKLFFHQQLVIPAKNPIPPTLWGYNDAIEDYIYDLAKAKQLLTEAGYENGFSTTLWAMPLPAPYMPQPQKIARTIKANLATIGIDVQIITYDWETFLAKIQNGEHDLCLIGWTGDNGDPDNFLYGMLDQDNAVKPKALNFAFFKHEELHKLLIEAQQTSDKQERIALYYRAQEIIHAQAPWVPLVHGQQVAAVHKNVHDVVFHAIGGGLRFYRTWIE